MFKNFNLFGKSDSKIFVMFAAVLLIFCGGFSLKVSAQNDQKIEEIRKIYKETNEKIKKNPAEKTAYLKTYTTNPDVKAFIKLRKTSRFKILLSKNFVPLNFCK